MIETLTSNLITVTQEDETVILPTEDTPKVVMDKKKGHLLIEGASFPENPGKFYEPIIMWLNTQGKGSKSKFLCEFKFNILSSASNKMIYELLSILEKFHSQGMDVKAKWYYEGFDTDMYDEGCGYKECIKMPFELAKI